MKIMELWFSRMHNEEWMQLFSKVRDLIDTFTKETIGVADLYEDFITLYEHAGEALRVLRRSVETQQMKEADRKRDRLFRGLADAIKSSLNHFDAAKQAAAEEIKIVLDNYGNVARRSGDEESAALYHLLNNLNNNHAPQMQLLGLQEWAVHIDGANKAYGELVDQRSHEVVSRSPYKMVKVRLEMQAVYNKMVERINALQMVSPTAERAAFISQLNFFIKQRKDVEAQRQGIRKRRRR